jgi:hypothetical protein
VTGIFLYLTACTIKNRIVRRLRRLRQPRYLAGLVVGLLYLYWFVVRNQLRAVRRGRFGLDPALLSSLAPDIVVVVAFLLWLALVAVWLLPSSQPAWRFAGAEVQFFYTAPVSRRTLLNYKLLRSQTGILFAVLIASLFGGAATAAAAGRWSLLIGGWLLFATMFLHVQGVSLTKASIRAPTGRVPWRAWVPMGIMVALSGLLVGAVAVHVPALAAMRASDAIRAAVELGKNGVAGVALWPFKVVVAPLLAPSLAAFAKAAAIALGLFAVNYWWVLQSDATLEEAAVAAEKQQAAGTRRALAPAVRAAPFALGVQGRPETAILWKNLILLGRYASARTLLRVLLPFVVLAIVAGASPKGIVVAPLVLILAGFATFMGPYVVRNDLRHDMPRLAVLKTWPIRGGTLLVGELLAPALVLSVVVWCALAVVLALSGSRSFLPLPLGSRVVLAIVAALVAPMLIAGQLIVQNAAVILFPGWIPTGGARPRGIEAMGQNILMFAGTLLALAVGVLPAAAVGAGVGFVLYQLVGWPGLLPAGCLVAAVLLLETGLALALLGRVLERTEPSQVEASE